MVAISNSQLASRVESLVQSWTRRERQYANWAGGTATGGPQNDGRYELTDGSGRVHLVASPAALADMLEGPAGVASAAAATAVEARAQALLEAARIDGVKTLVDAALLTANRSRDEARLARDEAQASEANARVYREGAALDAASTSAHRDDAQYAAAWAENWGVEAKAAADRAGNYDPLQYATRADGLTQIAGLQEALNARLATSAFTWGNLPGKPATFVPSTHTHDWAEITGRPALMIAGQTVTIPHGTYGFGGFYHGNGDGASYTLHNFTMKGWWGMGLTDFTDTVRGFYDFRAGRWDTKGGYRVDGHDVWHKGVLTPLDINKGAEIRAYTAFRPGFNANVATANARSLEVHGEYGPDGVSGAALMTFHRPGVHAVYFGLDTDNQLKVGGWSRGAVSYRLWTEENFNPATKLDNYHSAWIGSSEGAPRFFFGVNGRTFIRGEGIELRGKNDQTLIWFEDNQNIQMGGSLYINNNWLRIRGNTGVYWENFGGGWQMVDDTWMRSFNNKHVLTGGIMRADQGFYVGSDRQPVIRSGTAAPSGGVDGDLYIQF